MGHMGCIALGALGHVASYGPASGLHRVLAGGMAAGTHTTPKCWQASAASTASNACNMIKEVCAQCEISCCLLEGRLWWRMLRSCTQLLRLLPTRCPARAGALWWRTLQQAMRAPCCCSCSPGDGLQCQVVVLVPE
jgi:hypothetical protein